MTAGRRVALAGFAGAVILLSAAMLPFLLRQMTDAFLFHPVRGQRHSPSDFGLAFEELMLPASDGVQTQAWWIPYEGPDPLGVAVLTFHGNGGTMAERLDHTRALHDLGVSVLTAEYRGYGASEGRPSEEGLADDALAAFDRMAQLAPDHKLVIHGRSLGGAVAIRLASERRPAGLAVESTFTTLRDMAGRSGIPLATQLVAYEFASIDRVGEITCPLFVVHGTADDLIPHEMGERLHAAAGGPAELLSVAGGTHNDTWVRAGPAYWDRLDAWLKGL